MDRYAVIGNPVAHSLSPYIHAEFAKQTRQNLIYEAIEAPLNGFKETIMQFQNAGGQGANVTLPFKIEAYQVAQQCSEYVEQARAANVLVFHKDGSVSADSTDGIGLIRDLENNSFSFDNKRILIVGAGGAVRTILAPLLQQKNSRCVIANRTPEKAIQLAHEFKSFGCVEGIGLSHLQDSYDLIINATSAGLSGDLMSLPNQLISRSTWCYDLMYGAKKSTFLDWALQNKAEKCLDGLGMLVEQAAESFFIWRGVRPETQSILHKLRASS